MPLPGNTSSTALSVAPALRRNFDLEKKGFDESSGRSFDLQKYQKQGKRSYEPYVPPQAPKLALIRPEEAKPPEMNYTPSATK